LIFVSNFLSCIAYFGDLKIIYGPIVFWKNQRVNLHWSKHTDAGRKYHGKYLSEILLALVLRPNAVVTSDELFEKAWKDDSLGPDNPRLLLRQAIIAIRNSFRVVDPEFDMIKTINWTGFVWATGASDAEAIDQNLSINRGLMKIWWKGSLVPLTASQFRMLSLMIGKRDYPVSFENLYYAWANTVLLPADADKMKHGLAVQFSSIRKMFRKLDPSFNQIRNVRGEGMVWDSMAPL
jgi:DNA-binding winged helix-turn-helix (wHTH) protein